MFINIDSSNFSYDQTMAIINGLKERGLRFIGQVDGPYNVRFEADNMSVFIAAANIIAVTSYYYDDINGHTFFSIDGEEFEHYKGMTALEVVQAA